MERTWTKIGADYVEQLGRAAVEREIDGFLWEEVPAEGSVSVGALPGLGIGAVVEQLELPKRLSRIAISSFERPGFYPGFYGIETSYKDGLARIYVLDVGTEIVPVASDFWAGAEVVRTIRGQTEVWEFAEAAVS